jgi:hypothetical protein
MQNIEIELEKEPKTKTKTRQYTTPLQSNTKERKSIDQVIIKNIDIPFLDLVVLLVKVAFASIPAAMIMTFISALFFSIFGGLISGFWRF